MKSQIEFTIKRFVDMGITQGVLLSIKPEWWNKILMGQKTLELRKTIPKLNAIYDEIDSFGYVPVFIHVSGSGDGVQGLFLCNGFQKVYVEANEKGLYCHMVPKGALEKYARGNEFVWGWQVTEPSNIASDIDFFCMADLNIQRAPQSWCYVNLEGLL